MDYNVIRNSWDKESYSTPLDKLPMKKNLDKFRGCIIAGAAGIALGAVGAYGAYKLAKYAQEKENGIVDAEDVSFSQTDA